MKQWYNIPANPILIIKAPTVGILNPPSANLCEEPGPQVSRTHQGEQ